MSKRSVFNPHPQYRFPIRVDWPNSAFVMSAEAIPFSDAERMTFDLMFGLNTALQVDIRFCYGNDRNVVVLNSLRDGAWKGEKRVPSFPFKQDRLFQLKVKAGESGLLIFVNGEKFADYNNDSFPVEELCEIDQLNIYGDLRVHFVKHKTR